jgi:hypothetical protein
MRFCGSTFDRIDYCLNEAFAGGRRNLCLHITNMITEEESFDSFSPTCFFTSRLRRRYQAGRLTLEAMKRKITEI